MSSDTETEYELHYFNTKGYAEVSRLIFAAVGKKFEDVRYTQEAWPAEKEKMPFGTVPVLKIKTREKTEVLAQTFAIATYLAKVFGLYGSSLMEEARIEEMVECTRDMFNDLVKMYHETDETKKGELQENFITVKVPQHLNNFDKVLKRNGGGKGYIIGKSCTLADLQLYVVLDYVKDVIAEDNDKENKYNRLREHRARVADIPGIKKWLAERPGSDH